MYYASKEFLRNPDFLWRPVDEVRKPILVGEGEVNIFHYNPILIFLYASLILFNLPPIFLISISFLIIVFFTYKLNSKAVPLLFISFLFLRSVIQGEGDTFVAALALLSVYFFDKKPLLSGIFSGLAFLTKQTGAIVLVWFVFSVLIFKRKEIKFNIKNNYLLAILAAVLITTVWLMRNYVLYEGDVVGTFTGLKTSQFESAAEWLSGSKLQANSPEMSFLDLTGYYPNPIDLLLILGIIFLIIDIYRKRKLDYINFFVLLSLIIYIISQVLSLFSFMTIRYYLLMFPLIAVLVSNNLNEKYFKYLLIVSIAIFIFYISSLQKYSFNQLKEQIDTAWCPQIKQAVGMKPVYIDFFHHFFLAYECDLNLTDLNHSMYTVNLTSGSIYPTNKTTS
jgi:4-amino-4-deoxy-L-arabinose transferase-like glycosyltransferase